LRRAKMARSQDWILQPVMLRQNRFTKAIRRLLHGGKWSQSPVPPRKQQAYETCVSTGSTAVTTPIVLGSIWRSWWRGQRDGGPL
jgi:hypothetical protein